MASKKHNTQRTAGSPQPTPERHYLRNPRLFFLALSGSLAVIALLIALPGHLGRAWAHYDLRAAGLSLDLPAPPNLDTGGTQGSREILYQASTPEVAVLIHAKDTGDAPPRVPLRHLLENAMAQVQQSEGITDLTYQVTERLTGGRPCLEVSGLFRRQGTGARLLGRFWSDSARHAHVLCFFSSDAGARAGRRVLDSVRHEASGL